MVCPAVKNWKISANQHVNTWILPSDSKIDLEFKNLEFEFQVDLKLTDKGYIKPIVYDVQIKFGDSYFYHEDQFIAFIMHQFIYFSIVIIENSVYFVGEYIFTNMMGPIIDNYLNHYNFDFNMTSPLPGQDTKALFRMNYENTQDPYIGDGWFDTFMEGQLSYEGMGCEINAEPMEFVGDDSAYSQLVISDSAASCMAKTIARSPIGRIELDETRINKLFARSDIKLDSSSLAEHIPIF